MPENDKFFSVNIREYLVLGNDEEAGEPALVELLSGFSCPKNPDVERFLKKSAIEFTKKNQSVTYLVVSAEDVRLLRYFTLALKPLTVKGDVWKRVIFSDIKLKNIGIKFPENGLRRGCSCGSYRNQQWRYGDRLPI